MRPMRIPLMRYPGGCFADYYHWENGIGNRDKRPEVYGPLGRNGIPTISESTNLWSWPMS